MKAPLKLSCVERKSFQTNAILEPTQTFYLAFDLFEFFNVLFHNLNQLGAGIDGLERLSLEICPLENSRMSE